VSVERLPDPQSLPVETAATTFENIANEVLLTAALVENADVVVGVPINDTGLKKAVRRVILLAATGATFYVCHFVVSLLRGQYSSKNGDNQASSIWTAVSSLLIELSIPACGYCGAVYGNRQLTCCFCSCNLFITIVTVMTFIRVHIRLTEVAGNCSKEGNAQQRNTCEVWMRDGPDKYIMLSTSVLMVVLGCMAFWYGNGLYTRLAHNFRFSTAPQTPLVGEVIPLASLPNIGPALANQGQSQGQVRSLFGFTPATPVFAGISRGWL